jgi:hypothetical protein
MKYPFSVYKDWLVLSAMFIAEMGALAAYIYIGVRVLS